MYMHTMEFEAGPLLGSNYDFVDDEAVTAGDSEVSDKDEDDDEDEEEDKLDLDNEGEEGDDF